MNKKNVKTAFLSILGLGALAGLIWGVLADQQKSAVKAPSLQDYLPKSISGQMPSSAFIASWRKSPEVFHVLSKCTPTGPYLLLNAISVEKEAQTADAYSLIQQVMGGLISESDFVIKTNNLGKEHYLLTASSKEGVVLHYNSTKSLSNDLVQPYSPSSLAQSLGVTASLEPCSKELPTEKMPETDDLDKASIFFITKANIPASSYAQDVQGPSNIVVYKFTNSSDFAKVTEVVKRYLKQDEKTYTEMSIPSQNVVMSDMMTGYIGANLAVELNEISRNSVPSVYMLKAHKYSVGTNSTAVK